MLEIEQGKTSEREAAAAALAKQVAAANLAQVTAMLKSDMEVLKEKLPKPQDAATENAKDLKYLRERQQSLGVRLCVKPRARQGAEYADAGERCGQPWPSRLSAVHGAAAGPGWHCATWR